MKNLIYLTFLFVINTFAVDSLTFIDAKRDKKEVWHIMIETETGGNKLIGKFYKIGDIIVLGKLNFKLESTNGKNIWIRVQLMGTTISSTLLLEPHYKLFLTEKGNEINVAKSKRINSRSKRK